MNHYLIPQWPAPPNVYAYTTLRQGGHSLAPFDSFNLDGNLDKAEHIAANRQQLQQELHLPNHPCWLNQVHGNRVICVHEIDEKLPQADAAYSTQPHYVCVVSTADCLPIFLCDRQGTKVAVMHCGWRGLASRVIQETLKAVSIAPEETLIWLGPAIGPTMFEVGNEVREQFMQLDADNATAFKMGTQPGKWFGDLYTLAKLQLQQQGITQVYGGNFCTYTDKERFFSYRRDKGKTGRMANLIWLT